MEEILELSFDTCRQLQIENNETNLLKYFEKGNVVELSNYNIV